MATAEKNGHWYIVESRPVIIDGKKQYKQKWIPIVATNKEEAYGVEDEYKKSKKKGLKIDPNLTVYKLSKMWMEQHVKSPIDPLADATQVFYQSRLDLYIIPVIGAKKITELAVEDYEEVFKVAAKKVVDEKGELDTTLDSIYSTMNAMFNWGKQKRKIKEHLMEYVDAPVVAEREYTLLEKENIPTLLEAIITPQKNETKYAHLQRLVYHAAFVVELTTALRIDEICGIRDGDIDFNQKVLFIRQQVLKAGRNPSFGDAKDRRKDLPDKIPLADVAIEALQEAIEIRNFKKDEAKRKGLEWTEYGLVFTNRNGGPLDSDNLNARTFKKALKDAGLPRMKFHNLRHSVLTILSNSHEDPNAICNLARHKDYDFFKSRYLHPDVEAQRPAVEKLEKLIPAKLASKNFSKNDYIE